MESKRLEAQGAAPAADAGAAGEAREEAGAAEATQAAGSCCVLQTVVREGRVMTVCVATCCDAAPAA